jgi:hypothetical protein
MNAKPAAADQSVRAVRDMNCPLALKQWGRGFKSHSKHGFLCAFISCLSCPVCRLRPYDWLIHLPRSPAYCVLFEETERVAKT